LCSVEVRYKSFSVPCCLHLHPEDLDLIHHSREASELPFNMV